MKHGLEKNYFRFCTFKNRIQKYSCFVKNLIHDFLVYPKYTFKGICHIFKHYPGLKLGVVNYLDVRDFFGLKLDVIHSPFSTPRVLDKVYLLSKVLNVPFNLCFRAHDIYENDNFHEVQKRSHIIKEALKVITISEYNRDYMRKLTDIGDIEIIHSAINLDYFSPGNGKKSPNLIITVSRLDDEKGINFLINACHILNKRNIDYECTIIGEGPEKTKYEKLIHSLNVPNIKFINYLPYDEIKELLNRSTVFVLPCIIGTRGQRDILANVLKEAMAMQVPVITSNVCGIEELVDDGINGILTLQKDPEAIADAIERIFSNPETGRRIGEEGRKKIEIDFNIKIEAGKLEKILMNVVGQKYTEAYRKDESEMEETYVKRKR